MTEWLIENREWLGTAIPFSAIMSAIIFWLLSSEEKPAVIHLQDKPKGVFFISNTHGYAVSSKIEFPLLMPEHKNVMVMK